MYSYSNEAWEIGARWRACHSFFSPLSLSFVFLLSFSPSLLLSPLRFYLLLFISPPRSLSFGFVLFNPSYYDRHCTYYDQHWRSYSVSRVSFFPHQFVVGDIIYLLYTNPHGNWYGCSPTCLIWNRRFVSLGVHFPPASAPWSGVGTKHFLGSKTIWTH